MYQLGSAYRESFRHDHQCSYCNSNYSDILSMITLCHTWADTRFINAGFQILSALPYKSLDLSLSRGDIRSGKRAV